MNLQTADKPTKDYRIFLTLTLIPVTDFVGVNWFYVGNTIVALGKIGFLALFIPVVIGFYITIPNFGAVVYIFLV